MDTNDASPPRPGSAGKATTSIKHALLSPAWLVVGSVVSVQAGQGLGRQMFDTVGPATVVMLRLVFASAIFMLMWRPRPPTSQNAIALTIGLGTAIAGMNLIYPALARLPLGVAVSLQLLGPLAVAVVASRRLRDLGWAGLACGGVALFYGPGDLGSAMGTLLALLAGASMGAYVVLNKMAGARSVDVSLLCWSVVWAALLSLPTGLASTAAVDLQLDVLLLGAVVAVLSAVIPYSLDLAALRRLPVRVVATLESLEPVAAGAAGVAILGEHLRLVQWAAVACITAAAVGASTDQSGEGVPRNDPRPPIQGSTHGGRRARRARGPGRSGADAGDGPGRVSMT